MSLTSQCIWKHVWPLTLAVGMGLKINRGFKSRISSWDMKTDILAHGNRRRRGICQGGDEKKGDPMKSIPSTASNMSREGVRVLMNLSSVGKVKWLLAKKDWGENSCSLGTGEESLSQLSKTMLLTSYTRPLFCGQKKKSHFMSSLGSCSLFRQHLKAALFSSVIRQLGLWVSSRNPRTVIPPVDRSLKKVSSTERMRLFISLWWTCNLLR